MSEPEWTDVATFIVAALALLLSGVATYVAYKQARVAERATRAAEQSADAAEETLQTTQKLEGYEAARLHAERMPKISLEHQTLRHSGGLALRHAASLVKGVRLTNETSARYDEWRVQVDLTDPSTAKVLTGLLDEDGQVVPEVTVADVDHGQDVDLKVKRVSDQGAGEAKFVVIARTGDEEWRVVQRLTFQGPARVSSVAKRRLPGR